MDKVVVMDTDHRYYIVPRKDYDRMIHNHPSMKTKLVELVTIHECNDYIQFHQKLHMNKVI
jgi:hypothetical protein